MPEQLQYRCAWEIDVEAKSPEEAARLADKFMREQPAFATWTVTAKIDMHTVAHIDVPVPLPTEEE